MALQPRAVGRYGVEYARDAVRDVVLDDVAHEERGEVDADDGVHQVEPVVGVGGEVSRQQRHYLVDQPVQHRCRHSCQHAHHECQQQEEHLVADML